MAVQRNWKGRQLLARIRAGVRRQLEKAAILVQAEVKITLSGESPSAPGNPPGVMTGTLRRSIQIDRSQIDKLRVAVGPDISVAPYARVQELGGTILPRTAKALAVPIGQQGRSAARQAAGRGLRSLDLVYVPRKGKPPLLARTTGKGIIPLFVLLSSVTLPERPYLRPTAKRVRPRVMALFSMREILK